MFKGSSSFYRDQIYTITQWFGQWSDCEQTVALYTLLRQLNSRQARFIEHLLQEQASTDPSVDGQESKANNLEFVHALNSSTKLTQDELIQQLLTYFPLLHPGNEKVKNEYLKVIPKVLSCSVENGTRVEDCRKLLTYTLIHPAVSNEERGEFTKWLGQLERQYCMKMTQTKLTHSNIQHLSSFADHIDSTLSHSHSANNISKDSGISTGDNNVFTEVDISSHHLPLHATTSAPPYGSGGIHAGSGNNNHRKLSRTASWKVRGDNATSSAGKTGGSMSGSSAGHWRSHTPPHHSNNVSEWVNTANVTVTNNEGAPSPSHSDHAPLSPQSSLSSTDSDHENRSGVFYQENSGMKEFPAWLKGLRLHKYSQMFRSMSYEEMLNLDEKWLEDRSVTQGARKKIVQSIMKLKERSDDLKTMEKNVIQGANLRQVLSDLKAIVHSPIKPYIGGEGEHAPISVMSNDISDNDLPSLINRIMGRLCTQLLVNSRVEDECYPTYISLIDKCMHHEAFTVKQRKLLQEWRSQVLQRNNSRMITGRQEQRLPLHRPTGRTNSWNPVRRLGSSNKNGGSTGVYAQRALQAQGQWYNGFEKKALTVTYSGPEHLNVPQPIANPPKLQGGKSAIHRTQSAPIRAHPTIKRAVTNSSALQSTEPEINERLDSLARSMTEAALSSQDSVEHGDGDGDTLKTDAN